MAPPAPPPDDVLSSPSTQIQPASTATATTNNTRTNTAAAPLPTPHNAATVVDAQIHEKLLKDYKRLRTRVDALEKENESLKNSLWEFSWKWGKNGSASGKERAKAASYAPPSAPSIAAPPAPPSTATTTTAVKEVEKEAPSLPASTAPSSDTSQTDSALPTPTLPLPTSSFPSLPTPTPTAPSSTTSSAHPLLPNAKRERTREKEKGSWKFQYSYTLKGHRGAVYTVRFSEGAVGGRRVLASGGFDGVRLWGVKRDEGDDADDEEAKKVQGEEVGKEKDGERKKDGNEEDDRGEDGEEEDQDPWDTGDVDEIAHLTPHTAPVSSLAFSPSSSHLLTGGYDSTLHIFPLSSPSSLASEWSIATEGLAQSVCWIENDVDGNGGGNLIAWGTSGKMLGVGDKRVGGGKTVMEWRGGEMINSVQSLRNSPHLLTGDSAGQIRHFSLRTASFLPSPSPTPTETTGTKTKGTPISCLALNPDWVGRGIKKEPRWIASTGFDNSIKIYDRSFDPIKNAPKLVQTLKGKNRNWPIKAAWFQGKDYVDSIPTTAAKRRQAASRTRSRSASFSSDRPYASSDDDSDTSPSSTRPNPLSSSLLLATGSSDPVVLLYDLTKPLSMAPEGVAPQRLEGHKDSVYAVDWLMSAGEGGNGYKGKGLLASSGADYTVRVWKPVWKDNE